MRRVTIPLGISCIKLNFVCEDNRVSLSTTAFCSNFEVNVSVCTFRCTLLKPCASTRKIAKCYLRSIHLLFFHCSDHLCLLTSVYKFQLQFFHGNSIDFQLSQHDLRAEQFFVDQFKMLNLSRNVLFSIYWCNCFTRGLTHLKFSDRICSFLCHFKRACAVRQTRWWWSKQRNEIEMWNVMWIVSDTL